MITWVCLLWFMFYLLNYAELTRIPANWIRRVLGPKLSYPLSCGICWPFWCTVLGCLIFLDVAWWWCVVAPVAHLFLDLAYQKLSGNCPPCIDKPSFEQSKQRELTKELP